MTLRGLARGGVGGGATVRQGVLEGEDDPNAACPLAEAAGAVDGEGAPPGGPDAQAAVMRVNEKYSTLPAEDRSVHIINICAIVSLGTDHSGQGSCGGGEPDGSRDHRRQPCG